MRKSSYDKFPVVPIPSHGDACVGGWSDIGRRLNEAVIEAGRKRTIVVVDCYTGALERDILAELTSRLKPAITLGAWEALQTEEHINRLCAPFLGGDDPLFGRMSDLELRQFFDEEKLAALRSRASRATEGLVLIVGVGARLIHEGDLVIYADMPRWEAQRRQRRNLIGNLGVNNHGESPGLKYKRAFFVDWRVCDRWKLPILDRMDFLLDTTRPEDPKLAAGSAVRRGMEETVRRPFRLVPFFDPGPWGGQWMKEVCDLDRASPNYAWCFDCVPEENSLLLGIGEHRVEIPSVNVVLRHPRELLGAEVHARFGAEFPIRFDFLDTMGGGNLSLQVHPLDGFIREKFGMRYTQDESYYMLDAGGDASVWLGFKEGFDREALVADLKAAQAGGKGFEADSYVAKWPAKKHDHFLIPAGTIHCSGANGMVLEISATPYIFTFKLWDWNRLGMDGRPRPINIERGLENLQWDRTADVVRKKWINRIELVGEGEGWREERTGLHEEGFIETRRHWFSKKVQHHTDGRVNVLNLIEGDEIVVESPTDAFVPFVVHYAETFVVPAAVGGYTIQPCGASKDGRCATIKASVRS